MNFEAQTVAQYQIHIVDHLEKIASSAFPDFSGDIATSKRQAQDSRDFSVDSRGRATDLQARAMKALAESMAKLSTQAGYAITSTEYEEHLARSASIAKAKLEVASSSDPTPQVAATSMLSSTDKQDQLHQRQTSKSEKTTFQPGAISPSSSQLPPRGNNPLNPSTAVTSTGVESSPWAKVSLLADPSPEQLPNTPQSNGHLWENRDLGCSKVDPRQKSFIFGDAAIVATQE